MATDREIIDALHAQESKTSRPESAIVDAVAEQFLPADASDDKREAMRARVQQVFDNNLNLWGA